MARIYHDSSQIVIDPCMIDCSVRDNILHVNVRYEPRVAQWVECR